MKYTILILATLALSGQGIGAELGKAKWIDHMSTVLPTMFCDSDNYFRQCFEVSAQECEEVAASSARVCLEKSRGEMPEVLHQPQDGTRWGKTVGTCAGIAYEANFATKRIQNAKCRNINNWK